MSKYNVNFTKLISETLPPRKRREKRTEFIFKLLKWVRGIQSEFGELRVDLDEQAKITSHVIVFESYLVDLFGADITITVNAYQNVEQFIADDEDEGFGFEIAHEDDAFGGGYISADDDDLQDVNFIVNVPVGLDADLVKMSAIIDRFKTPGSTYEIVEF